jgi:hypothetical protein
VRWPRSYAIYNGQTPDAFLAAVSWHFQGGTLDAAAMHDALQTLRSDHPRDLSALARVERHRHLRELRASEKTAREMNPSRWVTLRARWVMLISRLGLPTRVSCVRE